MVWIIRSMQQECKAFSCIFTRSVRIFLDYSQPVLHCTAVFRADLHQVNRIRSPLSDLYSPFMVNIHFGAYTFQSLPLAVKPLAVSANALFVILSEVKDPKTPSSDKKHSACRKSVP